MRSLMHFLSSGRFALISLCFLIWILPAACMQTSYSEISDAPQRTNFFDRSVEFKLYREFFQFAPECVVISIRSSHAINPVSLLIARSFERYLRDKIKKVIGLRHAVKLSRKIGVSLDYQEDRIIFANLSKCSFLAEIEIRRIEDTFLLIWANRSIDLNFQLLCLLTGKTLFKSSHTAKRGNGGIPLSAYAMPISLAQAAKVTGDREIFLSLADDAARRMLKPLPDLR